ncbi:uncharacterized protein J3D65DRAFT_205821 [Phyllosticta citribraziliensis]|uniref:Secreted protein n=1 Tax=Phyllosticta citribraziliensis TaxID=989973 RepID=A0ABR1M506_9PEZI
MRLGGWGRSFALFLFFWYWRARGHGALSLSANKVQFKCSRSATEEQSLSMSDADSAASVLLQKDTESIDKQRSSWIRIRLYRFTIASALASWKNHKSEGPVSS